MKVINLNLEVLKKVKDITPKNLDKRLLSVTPTNRYLMNGKEVSFEELLEKLYKIALEEQHFILYVVVPLEALYNLKFFKGKTCFTVRDVLIMFVAEAEQGYITGV